MINHIIGLLGGNWIRLGIAAVLIGYGVAQYRININRAEARGEIAGEKTAHQKTEAKNAEVKEAGRAGSSNHGKPVAGSVRDPRYRD